MTISSALVALQQDITNARSKIVQKGGSVTSGGGSSQLATDINTIPTGITPTGTINITTNGNHNVTQYATANVNIPSSVFKWGGRPDDFFNGSQPDIITLSDIVIEESVIPVLPRVFRYSTIKSLKMKGGLNSQSYMYEFMCSDCNYLEEVSIERGLAGGSYVNQYMCRYMFSRCPALKKFYSNALTIETSASNGCNYMFAYDGELEEVVFDGMATVGASNAFQYGCRECKKLKNFSLLSGNTNSYICNKASCSSTFNYSFYNALAMFDQTINTFRAPMVTTIGYNTGTTTSSVFRQAFYLTSTNSDYYGKMYLILPELTAIYNQNTTSSNGHFNGCNALGKVYLPKFTEDGDAGQNIFGSCQYITEIHFGIENQATIEALSGYASKFGAANASLIFDMPNHITVNGTVYDRHGGNYDYDNSYYSWKNGNNIIYTTNAINPDVGDTTYTKSGTTYTAGPTITAIS